MNLDEIKQLIDFIRERELSEFELETADFKMRMKSGAVVQMAAPALMPAPPVLPLAASAAPRRPRPCRRTTRPAPTWPSSRRPSSAPFYRAAEPGAKAFVDVGDSVRKGQVLCIIEAMKLMNEIDSEHEGEIVSIYVQNGQAVQHGERLFAIRLKS